MAYFDEQGRPTRHKDGYAKWTCQYDERGNIDREGLLRRGQAGPPGTRTATPGSPRVRRAGQLARQMQWGHDGSNGFTRNSPVRRAGQLDRAGLLRRARPAHPAQGRLRQVHRQVRRAGQPGRVGLLRRAGRPTRHKDGYARCTARYDERGNRPRWPASTSKAGPPGTRTATPG